MLLRPNSATAYLQSKTSSNIQGTFTFQGMIFREQDTTYITDGKFNVPIRNN